MGNLKSSNAQHLLPDVEAKDGALCSALTSVILAINANFPPFFALMKAQSLLVPKKKKAVQIAIDVKVSESTKYLLLGLIL